MPLPGFYIPSHLAHDTEAAVHVTHGVHSVT